MGAKTDCKSESRHQVLNRNCKCPTMKRKDPKLFKGLGSVWKAMNLVPCRCSESVDFNFSTCNKGVADVPMNDKTLLVILSYRAPFLKTWSWLILCNNNGLWFHSARRLVREKLEGQKDLDSNRKAKMLKKQRKVLIRKPILSMCHIVKNDNSPEL